MSKNTILTSRTGKTKGGKEFTTFGKIDPVFKTWKYGGCGKFGCGIPSTPKEHKESKTWEREDAKFYRKAVQNTGYGKDKKAMKRVQEGDIGIKSGEFLKGYGNS